MNNTYYIPSIGTTITPPYYTPLHVPIPPNSYQRPQKEAERLPLPIRAAVVDNVRPALSEHRLHRQGLVGSFSVARLD